jgi:hypothetical protein
VRRLRIDYVGMALSSVGLAGVTFGVIDAGEHGWARAAAVGPQVAGLTLLAMFTAWERRSSHTLIDAALFRSPGFTWARSPGSRPSWLPRSSRRAPGPRQSTSRPRQTLRV